MRSPSWAEISDVLARGLIIRVLTVIHQHAIGVRQYRTMQCYSYEDIIELPKYRCRLTRLYGSNRAPPPPTMFLRSGKMSQNSRQEASDVNDGNEGLKRTRVELRHFVVSI